MPSSGGFCYEAHDPGERIGMLNLVSIIIGLVSLVFVAIAFLPLFGWANWLVVPLAVLGAAIGALSRGTAGRNLNVLVIIIGVLRLMLGGGIL
jgi:hypothetical protein